MFDAIKLTLMFMQGLLSVIPQTVAFAPLITALTSAITELQKVHGSDVTRAQLEGLRIDPKW